MNIAVYCASGMPKDEKIIEDTINLGKWIGENGHTLVYGGGGDGLMGVIAQSVKQAGGKVIGVVPANVTFMKDRDHNIADEVIFTPNMSYRKQRMLELANAYIALPGGIGTIDEISEAITLTKIGVFDKKSVLFNTNDFYKPFKDMLYRMEEENFIKMSVMKHVMFSDSIEEIEEFLK